MPQKPHQFRADHIVIVKIAPAVTSWWTDYAHVEDRRAFDEKAKAERERMKAGRFGRTSTTEWES